MVENPLHSKEDLRTTYLILSCMIDRCYHRKTFQDYQAYSDQMKCQELLRSHSGCQKIPGIRDIQRWGTIKVEAGTAQKGESCCIARQLASLWQFWLEAKHLVPDLEWRGDEAIVWCTLGLERTGFVESCDDDSRCLWYGTTALPSTSYKIIPLDGMAALLRARAATWQGGNCGEIVGNSTSRHPSGVSMEYSQYSVSSDLDTWNDSRPPRSGSNVGSDTVPNDNQLAVFLELSSPRWSQPIPERSPEVTLERLTQRCPSLFFRVDFNPPDGLVLMVIVTSSCPGSRVLIFGEKRRMFLSTVIPMKASVVIFWHKSCRFAFFNTLFSTRRNSTLVARSRIEYSRASTATARAWVSYFDWFSSAQARSRSSTKSFWRRAVNFISSWSFDVNWISPFSLSETSVRMRSRTSDGRETLRAVVSVNRVGGECPRLLSDM